METKKGYPTKRDEIEQIKREKGRKKKGENERREKGKLRNKGRGVDFMSWARWTYVQCFVHLAD